MQNIKNKIPDIIKFLRKEQKLTLNQLAKKVEINTSSLSRIERGEINISVDLLERIAKTLNVSPQIFFDSTPLQKDLSGPRNSFVEHFRLSAKFIYQFNKKIFVIAFGAEVLKDEQLKQISHDINLLHSLNIKLVLIHGIRPHIDHKLIATKQPTRLVRNQRVTDKQSLEHIIEVNGRIHTEIQATLSSSMSGSPMAGSDIKVSSGNFITAKPIGVIDGVDMEYTGQIRKVDNNAILDKLSQNEIVLISPIGFSPVGEIFNLSYEQTAAYIAGSIKADKLIYFVDSDGVLNKRGELIPEMTTKKAKNLIQNIEKNSSPENAAHISYKDLNILKSSLFAIKQNVEKIHLINRNTNGSLIEELYTDKGSGTILTEYALEKIRPASVKDVKAIYQLIEPLGMNGKLITRANEQIEQDLKNFIVIEYNHDLIGCAALYPYKNMSEISCFAIHTNYQRQGFGMKLLNYCEKKINSRYAFILTTQSEHWFKEKGFVETHIDSMPAERRKIYHVERNSKFFTKKL
ncbi:MAG: amino-acid N-acetyltransferase [Methylophilaceae bacterium]|nr:amino-acid N-acetyltransferase [Methylophilaceae bacterium]